MEKEFIPYEQALALKGLGFDESCLYCYFPNPNYRMGEKFDLVETTRMLPSQIKNIGELIKDGSFDNTILAPLYQQAFRWFREKYELSHSIESHFTDEWFYFYKIEGKYRRYNEIQDFNTYEEAELECLKKLIEIVKNK